MLKSLNSNACIFKIIKEHRSEVDVIFLYVEAWWHCCRPSWKFRWGYLPPPLFRPKFRVFPL